MVALVGSLHVTVSVAIPGGTEEGRSMALTAVPAESAVTALELIGAEVEGVRLAVHEEPAVVRLVTFNGLPAVTTESTVRIVTLSRLDPGLTMIRLCAADVALTVVLAGSLQVTTSDAVPGKRLDGSARTLTAVPVASAVTGFEVMGAEAEGVSTAIQE
jgi:hypothetical protein